MKQTIGFRFSLSFQSLEPETFDFESQAVIGCVKAGPIISALSK